MSKSFFKTQHPFEIRQAESTRIRDKYPDRVLVIAEKAGRSYIEDNDKKRIKLNTEKAIFVSLTTSNRFFDYALYEDYNDEDGFLYMTYASFKTQHPFERRQAESTRIKDKYPDRVPVLVEKAGRSDIAEIDKKRSGECVRLRRCVNQRGNQKRIVATTSVMWLVVV
ncbi:hypothetical protein RYX36_034921 [Vicia faba]